MSAWLKVEQAAERAGVSVATIRRAIDAKSLKSHKLQPGGRLVRISEAELQAWITAASAAEERGGR